MGRKALTLGAVAVVATPLLLGVADELRMLAEGSGSATGAVDTGYGVASAVAMLEQVAANRGLFDAAAWIAFAAALVAIPALVLAWRLAVGRSPRWAWAGAVLAVGGVIGQVVHLQGYFGVAQVASGQPDLTAAATFWQDLSGTPLAAAMFAPYLVGMALAAPVQAVALRRARVLPTWAMVLVIVATALMAVVGSSTWSSAAYALLAAAGFWPAARAALRGRGPEGALVGPAVPAPARA